MTTSLERAALRTLVYDAYRAAGHACTFDDVSRALDGLQPVTEKRWLEECLRGDFVPATAEHELKRLRKVEANTYELGKILRAMFHGCEINIPGATREVEDPTAGIPECITLDENRRGFIIRFRSGTSVFYRPF